MAKTILKSRWNLFTKLTLHLPPAGTQTTKMVNTEAAYELITAVINHLVDKSCRFFHLIFTDILSGAVCLFQLVVASLIQNQQGEKMPSFLHKHNYILQVFILHILSIYFHHHITHTQSCCLPGAPVSHLRKERKSATTFHKNNSLTSLHPVFFLHYMVIFPTSNTVCHPHLTDEGSGTLWNAAQIKAKAQRAFLEGTESGFTWTIHLSLWQLLCCWGSSAALIRIILTEEERRKSQLQEQS